MPMGELVRRWSGRWLSSRIWRRVMRIWRGSRCSTIGTGAARRLVTRNTGAPSLLSLPLLAQGGTEEALREVAGDPDESSRLWALAIVHHVLGNRAGADVILRELIEKFAEFSAYSIAEVHGV